LAQPSLKPMYRTAATTTAVFDAARCTSPAGDFQNKRRHGVSADEEILHHSDQENIQENGKGEKGRK